MRIYALAEAFMDYAASLSDADLAYLILGFNEFICDDQPGHSMCQQLASVELQLRRSAQGKR